MITYIRSNYIVSILKYLSFCVIAVTLGTICFKDKRNNNNSFNQEQHSLREPMTINPGVYF